jgi:hypothetical protein
MATERKKTAEARIGYKIFLAARNHGFSSSSSFDIVVMM